MIRQVRFVMAIAVSVAIGCAVAPKEVRWPGALDLPPPARPLPDRPAFSLQSVDEVVPQPVQEEVIAGTPLPGFADKGLTLSVPEGAANVMGVDTGMLRTIAGLLPFTKSAVPEEAMPDGARQIAEALQLSLLRAGYTRFVDDRALRPLKARAEIHSGSASLVMEGSLDRIALLQKVPRVDYLLLVRRFEVAKERERIEVARTVSDTAVSRYFEDLRRADGDRARDLGIVQEAWAAYQAQAEAARGEAEAQLRGVSKLDEDFRPLRARLEQFNSGVDALKSRVSDLAKGFMEPVPSVEAETEQLKPTTGFVDADVFRCRALLTLSDAATGETIAAMSYNKRDSTAEGASAGVVNALTRRLLSNSNLKPAVVTGAPAREIPPTAPLAHAPAAPAPALAPTPAGAPETTRAPVIPVINSGEPR